MNLLNTGAYCGRTLEAAAPKPTTKVGDTTVVEHWDGHRWVEKKLVWDGQAFVEVEK